jgi:hypothetical protein
MSMNQLACFLADSGLTYTPTTGTALRLSIGGVKRWHLNDNIVDGATIDFDGSHALYVMADSGLAESFSGNGLKVVTDQTTIDLGAADPMGVPALRVKQYSIGWAQLNPGVWYKGLQANPSGGMGIMYRPMAHVDSVTIGFTGTNALYVVVEPDSGLDYDALTGKLRAEFDNVTITSDAYGLKVKNFSIDEYKIDTGIWYKGLMSAPGGMGIYNRPMSHIDSVTISFTGTGALAVDTSKIATQYDLAGVSIDVEKDLVAGDGLSGGGDNILPGTDSDVTLAVLLDFNGGLEIVDDSVNVKLDGGTLALSPSGLKVSPSGGVQFTADSLDGARFKKRTVPENALATSALYEGDLTAADFNVSSGTVSLDYANGQAASGSTKGFLTSTDWSTFNGKMDGTLAKDLVTTAPLTGGADNILPGADSDVTLALTVQKDLVAGNGLGGGADDILPGSDSDVTMTVLLDYNGGLEISDDSVNVKLDGATLALGASGLKVNPTGGVQFTSDSLAGPRLQKRTVPENALATSALYEADLTAADFNVSSGTVSLDYTNGQKASGSVPGFLSSTDWSTFNGKMDGTLAKDLVTTAPLTGGADNILPGADSDVTLALTVQKDLVAGNGLGGGADDILPGSDSDVTMTVLLDYNGGLEISDDSVNVKLDGSSLALSASGLKVADTYDDNFQLKAAFDDSLNNPHTVTGQWRFTSAVIYQASDGDVSYISTNTSDQMLFQNASGGYSFDYGVTLATGKKFTIGSLQWTRAASDSIDGAKIAIGTLAWEAMPSAVVLEGDLTSADFNTAAGVVSLDYANGQKASGSVAGFLSSTDWTTFNNSYDPGGTDVAVADGGTGTSTGSITGTGALAFTAGGSNQNVTLTPSGTGETMLGGNVGIGTDPGSKLTIKNLLTSTTGTDTSVSILTTFTPSGASAATIFGLRSELAITGAQDNTTNNKYAGRFMVRNANTGTSSYLSGVASLIQNESSGNSTAEYGLAAGFNFTASASGTVTTTYGFLLGSPYFHASSTAKIMTNYGLSVGVQYNTYNATSTTGGFTTYGGSFIVGNQGGNTSGTNNNYGVYVGGTGGTAGSGGTVNNYALYINGWLKSYFGGPVGLGVAAPTGILHLKAGTASAGTAPLKFSAGTNLTAAEAGAMEWDGTDLYITRSTGIRKKINISDTMIAANFTVWSSSSDGTIMGLVNTLNGAGGRSLYTAQVAGSSAGDAGIQFQVIGETAWTAWIDNSDDDKFCINPFSDLGGTSGVSITRGGIFATGTGGIKLYSSTAADSIRFVGIKPATYASGVNQMWVNASWDSLFVRGASGNAKYAKLTDLGKTH